MISKIELYSFIDHFPVELFTHPFCLFYEVIKFWCFLFCLFIGVFCIETNLFRMKFLVKKARTDWSPLSSDVYFCDIW